MVFIDGAGSAIWSGFRWNATGLTAAVGVVLISPNSGEKFPSLGVPLYFAVGNNGGTNTDVQVQVASDAGFVTVVSAPSPTNLPNGTATVQPTGLVAGTTYWWRARGAPTGTTTWGPWSATWTFAIDLNTGKACEYSMENIGIDPILYSGTVDSIMENVGVEIVLYPGGIEYLLENVGVEIVLDSDGIEYVYEGDVSSNTPTPHIWWLIPSAGRAGDGISVVGFGFGDLASTYGGVVEIYLPDTTGWTVLGTVSWQTFGANAHGYDELRHISMVLNEIDMQHQIIQFLIPDGSIPPGYGIRVRTVGP